jgi:heme-degrading monooxygenase HmoA
MVTIGLNYAVIKGKEEIFETTFRKVVQSMEDMEGHSESHLYRDIDDPQQYLILSKWSKRAAFDAFVGSETFRKVASWGKEEVLSGRPQHEIYGGDE